MDQMQIMKLRKNNYYELLESLDKREKLFNQIGRHLVYRNADYNQLGAWIRYLRNSVQELSIELKQKRS